jgi:hypothetical protein
MVEWLEAHMAPCVFVKYLQIECPGCGIQRAFIALLKGEFGESVKLFPALLPYIATIGMLIWQLIFKSRSGAYYVMYAFIVSVVVMITSYVVKLMT